MSSRCRLDQLEDSGLMTTVDFHFDPLCPFAYQTSVWIRDVRAQLGITINWRFFSSRRSTW